MSFSFRLAAPFLLCALSACATTGEDAAETTQAPAIKKAVVPTEPVFVKADVMGRSAAALDELFGQAALVRREGAGEFRRYTLAECALIVILHPDESGKIAAGHLDAAAKMSGEEKPDLDQCLARGLPVEEVS